MRSDNVPDLISEIDRVVLQALEEDLRGEKDHSSFACIPKEQVGKAELLIKGKGVLAGMLVAERTFHLVDPEVEFDPILKDGDQVEPGQNAFYASGLAHSLLLAERTLLNLMQRLSGVATRTQEFVKELAGTNTKVLDTRKTTSGLRTLEKWAVTLGGGINHRIGLYDMIMLKDNHVDHAGGVAKAIRSTKIYIEKNDLDIQVEIEVRDLLELRQVLNEGNVDRIMLDNFSFNDLESAVQLIDGQFETEASGGIELDTARRYAECGVDYISVGALTHSVKSLDLSLKTKT